MLGEFIRQAREKKGLSQIDVALELSNKLGDQAISSSYISQIEKAKNIRPDKERLCILAEILDLPADEVYRLADYHVESTSGIILVPKMNQPASAGPGAPAEPEYWPYHPPPEEHRHNYIAVEVTGDCMEPRIRRGQTVIVDRTASPKPGDVVVAIYEGETIVKELRELEGRLVLGALHSQPPIKVTKDTQILGVVKMVMHRP